MGDGGGAKRARGHGHMWLEGHDYMLLEGWLVCMVQRPPPPPPPQVELDYGLSVRERPPPPHPPQVELGCGLSVRERPPPSTPPQVELDYGLSAREAGKVEDILIICGRWVGGVRGGGDSIVCCGWGGDGEGEPYS